MECWWFPLGHDCLLDEIRVGGAGDIVSSPVLRTAPVLFAIAVELSNDEEKGAKRIAVEVLAQIEAQCAAGKIDRD